MVLGVPLLLLSITGALLLVKKQWSFVQPPETRGTAGAPRIGLDQILAAVGTTPGRQGLTWSGVDRIDLRPSKGIAKVQLHDGHEVQVDLGTAEVLQVARRRTGLIEALHDGSWFAGDWTKLGVMLPVSALLLYLLGSGLWMWWYPLAIRRRVRRQLAGGDAHGRREPGDEFLGSA